MISTIYPNSEWKNKNNRKKANSNNNHWRFFPKSHPNPSLLFLWVFCMLLAPVVCLFFILSHLRRFSLAQPSHFSYLCIFFSPLFFQLTRLLHDPSRREIGECGGNRAKSNIFWPNEKWINNDNQIIPNVFFCCCERTSERLSRKSK